MNWQQKISRSGERKSHLNVAGESRSRNQFSDFSQFRNPEILKRERPGLQGRTLCISKSIYCKSKASKLVPCKVGRWTFEALWQVLRAAAGAGEKLRTVGVDGHGCVQAELYLQKVSCWAWFGPWAVVCQSTLQIVQLTFIHRTWSHWPCSCALRKRKQPHFDIPGPWLWAVTNSLRCKTTPWPNRRVMPRDRWWMEICPHSVPKWYICWDPPSGFSPTSEMQSWDGCIQ